MTSRIPGHDVCYIDRRPRQRKSTVVVVVVGRRSPRVRDRACGPALPTVYIIIIIIYYKIRPRIRIFVFQFSRHRFFITVQSAGITRFVARGIRKDGWGGWGRGAGAEGKERNTLLDDDGVR